MVRGASKGFESVAITLVCVCLILDPASAFSIPKFPNTFVRGKEVGRTSQSANGNLEATSDIASNSSKFGVKHKKTNASHHHGARLVISSASLGNNSSERLRAESNATIQQEKILRAREGSNHSSLHPKILTRSLPSSDHKPKRSKKLDIVIAHYDANNIQEMTGIWANFLNGKKVKEWKPYVYIYCQNEKANLTEKNFEPLLKSGGEVLHIPNIGRESHAFLKHILDHYDDLAHHTIFAQDISNQDMISRFENLVENRTGFMPLSWWGHQECDDGWLPASWVPQMYSMFTQELCPVNLGYSSSFQGQFIVSKRRIRENEHRIYQRLQDYLEADKDHFIHQAHNHQDLKDRTAPLFGHMLERTWSLAFNCYESWRASNCGVCESEKQMKDCEDGDCQCFDRD